MGTGFIFIQTKRSKDGERSQYDVEKVYLKDGQIVDDFEESNDKYRLLMAMIQSDKWEFSNYESNQYSEQSDSESV